MTADPVTIEVIRATFNAAAERMRITMIRTAYNTIISETLDFGCALFDSDVQMIAQGTGVPIFQGHLGFPILATLQARAGETIHPGDIYLHNDPYAGNGNHINDVSVFSPVFWHDSLVGWVAVKAHWADVGGAVPSSILNDSTDFRQEGLRFQALRLCKEGVLESEVMRLIGSNIRVEANTLKDLNAMIAVCRVGEASFREILGKYGETTVAAAARAFMDQSERRTRAALRRLPSGTYRASGVIDNDGIDLQTPVRLEVRITIDDGGMTVDATGTSPQVKGPFNCGYAISVSACRLVLKCLTTPFEPTDEGCFRPLRVIIPDDSILSAREPAPVSRYIVPVNLLTELCLRALADAIPDRIGAGAFGDQMPTILIGTSPVNGRLYVLGELNFGGSGARPHGDGESGVALIGASTSQNTPVEVIESRHPHIRVLHYRLRPDSGGAGKFRGGLGLERAFRFDAPVAGVFTPERTATPPLGLWGGHDGAVNRITVTDPAGNMRVVRKATRYPIAAGETLTICSGGGGGLGNPAERDPRAIERDLREGYVSEEAARREYGYSC